MNICKQFKAALTNQASNLLNRKLVGLIGRKAIAYYKPTLRQAWYREKTRYRNVRSKCRPSKCLQFRLSLTVCCVLHRSTSLVIHRIE